MKDIIKLGACKLVGSGNTILVWKDPWLPDKSSFIPTPRAQVNNSCLVVSQLLNSSGSGWNDILLNDLFDHKSIVAIKTSQFGLLVWKIDGLGPNLKMGSSR